VIPITVSLVILTRDRWRTVERCLAENIIRAGYEIDELIHVDNGSDPQLPELFADVFEPDVQIRNKENLGVAKGYNRGLAMASKSHIVISGCDRILPRNWLYHMINSAHHIPETGVISVYSPPRFGEKDHSGRFDGPRQILNGQEIQPGSACEARFHSREFLMGAGFFREDFGLYGFEDCEWRDRASRHAQRNGLINYILPWLGYAEHIDDGKDDYEHMKQTETSDPRKPELVRWCHNNGNPHYNPYARCEVDMLSWVGGSLPKLEFEKA
jgi:GT2 family glycosyltransferase